MSDNDLDLEVRKITLQLQQLKVEQERLERQLNRVQARIRRRDRESAEGTAQGAGKGKNRSTTVAEPVLLHTVEINQGQHTVRNSFLFSRDDHRVLENSYSKVVPPAKGDRVRIKNPKKGQRDVGIVVNFCSDGKLKIRTDRDDIITRLPKNVNYFL